jgi:hypothetical protein
MMPARILLTGCRRIRIDVTTPKLPPPRSAQYKSLSCGCICPHAPAVGQNDLRTEQVIDGQSKPRRERPITAGEEKTCHTHGSDVSGNRRQSMWNSGSTNISGERTARHSRDALRCVHLHLPHVDHEAVMP